MEPVFYKHFAHAPVGNHSDKASGAVLGRLQRCAEMRKLQRCDVQTEETEILLTESGEPNELTPKS